MNGQERLTRRFEVKAVTPEGRISGYGSVFGNEDWYQDVVAPGAFTRSLKQRGMPAMLWQHQSQFPIGVWTQAKEDTKGLYLEGQLELSSRPEGMNPYELLKMGALDGLSIGYDTVKYTFDEKTGIRTLEDVDLFEVSPVTFPANEEARIDSVKAFGKAMTHGDVAGIAMSLGKLYGECKNCTDCGARDPVMSGLDSLAKMMGGSGGDAGTASRPVTPRYLEAVLRDAGLSRGEAKAVLANGLSGLRDAAAEPDTGQRDAGSGVGHEVVASLRGLALKIIRD